MTRTILTTTALATILLTSLFATIGIQTAYADTEIFSVSSGNGNFFEPDALITMLVGPAETGFNVQLTLADFDAAKNGPSAYVIPSHSAWVSSLSADPSAKYVGTHPINPNFHGPNSALATALYAVDFEVTSTSISSALLDIYYASDNLLGDSTNQGVFINGIPVSGTQDLAGNSFTQERSFTNLDITSMVHPGINTVYVLGADVGGPGGILFHVDINVEGTSVTPVTIDIKPGSTENPINTKSKGVIPVAVLSTDDFDAADIDASTVTFGPNSAKESHGKSHIEDVNGDGLDDLVLHFLTQDSGIVNGDTEACLSGSLTNGAAIEGCDSVKTK